MVQLSFLNLQAGPNMPPDLQETAESSGDAQDFIAALMEQANGDTESEEFKELIATLQDIASEGGEDGTILPEDVSVLIAQVAENITGKDSVPVFEGALVELGLNVPSDENLEVQEPEVQDLLTDLGLLGEEESAQVDAESSESLLTAEPSIEEMAVNSDTENSDTLGSSEASEGELNEDLFSPLEKSFTNPEAIEGEGESGDKEALPKMDAIVSNALEQETEDSGESDESTSQFIESEASLEDEEAVNDSETEADQQMNLGSSQDAKQDIPQEAAQDSVATVSSDKTSTQNSPSETSNTAGKNPSKEALGSQSNTEQSGANTQSGSQDGKPNKEFQQMMERQLGAEKTLEDSDSRLELGLQQNSVRKTESLQQQIQKQDLVQIPIRQNAHSPGFDKAFGERLMMMANRNIQVAHIRLDPPDLGLMEVKVQVQNEQTQVVMVSSNPQVRELLESAIPRLRQMLEGQGFSQIEAEVRDQSETFHQGQGGSGGGQGNGENAMEGETEIDVPSPIVSMGLVDHYV